jgi:hypothetical protein
MALGATLLTSHPATRPDPDPALDAMPHEQRAT